MFKKIILIGLLIVVLGLAWPVWYLLDLPDVSRLKIENPTTTAVRASREKQILARHKKPHSMMQWRDLDQIAPTLWQAVVISEDDTFFQHNGFDIEMLKKAIHTNWERKRFAFGASTITQQLARTLYLSSHKNLLRKAKEALITRELEKTLPKRRILELYLNVVEWGPQVYGAEAAAQYFYKKPASDLTLDEAIGLALILPSPWRWRPTSESRFMNRRKVEIYERMIRAHYIEPEIEPAPTPIPLGLELPSTEEEPVGLPNQ